MLPQNPIIRGFNPDPSFVRVGDDFYIATSTFEWFPGVQLHHSRDLIHWHHIGHALTRQSQLDLRGVTDSAGVWAPSMSYADGQFWLVYTIVRTSGAGRPFKDVGVYLVTAPGILGAWSEPTYINGIGFDPSLFHDDDGRKWFVNMIWDYRKQGLERFAGIVIQEFDPTARRLIGPTTKILQKEHLCEGPNIYRHDGWYYLMLAEGGTGWHHSISMARSRNITGPYELDPQPVVLTSRDDPSLPLQKAGHGEIIQTVSGEWYLAHLATRPITIGSERRCILGRETCLQRVTWSPDGWLRLAHGGTHPLTDLPSPANLAPAPWPAPATRDDFTAPALDPSWSTLRIPIADSWLTLTERPGWLRLRGRESYHSLHYQSLVAKRPTELHSIAQTCIDFHPTHYTQLAGLICYYDTRTHYYLRITHHETLGRVLGISITDDATFTPTLAGENNTLPINDWPHAHLRVTIHAQDLQFSASPDGETWQNIGPVLDATKLSDDYGQHLHFTGLLIGLCVQDLGGSGAFADFDYFSLESTE